MVDIQSFALLFVLAFTIVAVKVYNTYKRDGYSYLVKVKKSFIVTLAYALISTVFIYNKGELFPSFPLTAGILAIFVGMLFILDALEETKKGAKHVLLFLGVLFITVAVYGLWI